MNAVTPATIRAHVEATCPGTKVSQDEGSLFFIHDPRRDLPPNRQVPFATLTVSDKYDPGSDLARRGYFRLNIGVRPGTYQARFGALPPFPKDGGIVPGHDYTRVDTLLPHPIYAAMGWVCVVQPSPATWEQAKPMLAEAYALANQRNA
ncbi:MAG TPA: DUF6194 family protein [Candidatus Thermoplasmatota archaeon]|nr:DUF6194 family protein [Candidatus Thermoplasmatota archaeon]